MKSQHIKDYKNAFQYLTKNIDPSNQSTVRGEKKQLFALCICITLKWTKHSGHQKDQKIVKLWYGSLKGKNQGFFDIHFWKRVVTKHGGLFFRLLDILAIFNALCKTLYWWWNIVYLSYMQYLSSTIFIRFDFMIIDMFVVTVVVVLHVTNLPIVTYFTYAYVLIILEK